ncbi:hypothetical protein [Nocardiopsis sp. NRRL B-16309]|uniref:hypothetical protein n=1 Tax=Nocardiopsis sp. NRRL B-16309 TaxID=1519494 RepID=UPI0006AED376|nr:hypothetical protein [Nocardiopsis sp. NRRL B-16309]KOX24059.1 hypothetical protein ADL05_00075 [Nocardiopsis sp. NRRL B-16309]
MNAVPPDAPRPRTIDSMAARVVSRCAPAESAYYPVVRDEFFARGAVPRRPGDDPLGFGAVAVGVVAGIVLTVLNELIVGSLTDVLRPWWDRAWRAALRRLRPGAAKRLTPETELPVLPAASVPDVAAAITKHAVRSGLSPEDAARLTRELVAELAEGGRDSKPDDGEEDAA